MGTIRKRADGRWEGRCAVGYDGKTGKRIYKSVYAPTQREVRQMLTKITAEKDEGTYLDPSTLRLSKWLEEWLGMYVSGSVKPYTYDAYSSVIRNHMIPKLGYIKLSELSPINIQLFYNSLLRDGLSAKTIKNIHGVLHRALGKAVKLQMIKENPTDLCDLPRVVRKEIRPMENKDIETFLAEIRGHRFELLYKVTLFTGMRQGEVLGLTWDCVDFESSTLYVNKQLQKSQHIGGGTYELVTTKNSRGRVITVAPTVMEYLRRQLAWQNRCKQAAGSGWDNPWNLVFTNEAGSHLCHMTVYAEFKKIVRKIGMPNERFHDLRHSYAVVALESGDDIKTVQGNLGHATSSFTLDVYGHVSQKMRRQSADRMEAFIKNVSNT
ncbi:MAG: site-specific integrase [Oscillospiraceae bacterium]|nr:site-specific integrase [Oscillospiraceae bacterium]